MKEKKVKEKPIPIEQLTSLGGCIKEKPKETPREKTLRGLSRI